MAITDSQVHVWGADTPDRPWPPGRAHQAQKPYPVTKDMLRNAMDEAGVARVVIVPPSWEGDRNDLALEAARLHPDRFAVMKCAASCSMMISGSVSTTPTIATWVGNTSP